MGEHIVCIQFKTGYDADRGPAWISRVGCSKSWRIAHFHDLSLCKLSGIFDANFVDLKTSYKHWVSVRNETVLMDATVMSSL
ncbi:hypothetical protein D3C74_340090 [compost metagenome]